ncbi:hypothetical protein LTR10_014993 [Elasticomyces elasticus]|nr:hypothetical protein LTR10_014993 [Elasticomyces elasticus]KAK4964570.1 hypothetical protein LTR42_012867 [Elasticomyces elasticus]
MSHQHKENRTHILGSEDSTNRPHIGFEVDLVETREGDDVAMERYQKDGIALLAARYPQSNLNDVVGKKMFDIAQDVINFDEYGEDRPVGGYHSTEQPPAKLITWLGAAYICHETAAQHEDPIVAFGEDWEGRGIDPEEGGDMSDDEEVEGVEEITGGDEAGHEDEADESSEVEEDDELMDCDEVSDGSEAEEGDGDYEALRDEYATSHQRLVAWVNGGGRDVDGRAE